MNRLLKTIGLTMVITFSSQLSIASDMPDGAKIFSQKCKMCHALDKKKIGTAVKAMNSDAEQLRSAITNGVKRMPKFGHKLSAEEIDSLVIYIQAQKTDI